MTITKIHESGDRVAISYSQQNGDDYQCRSGREVTDEYVVAQSEVTRGFTKMLSFGKAWADKAVLRTLKLGWAKDDAENAKVTATIEVRQASGPPIIVNTPVRYLIKGAQVDGGGEVLVCTDTLTESIRSFLVHAENHVRSDKAQRQLFLDLSVDESAASGKTASKRKRAS